MRRFFLALTFAILPPEFAAYVWVRRLGGFDGFPPKCGQVRRVARAVAVDGQLATPILGLPRLHYCPVDTRAQTEPLTAVRLLERAQSPWVLTVRKNNAKGASER